MSHEKYERLIARLVRRGRAGRPGAAGQCGGGDRVTEAILVLDAGSSIITFSLFK